MVMNRIVNGAKPPLNVITNTRYTITIAISIAKASWLIAVLISSVAPPTLNLTLLGLSIVLISRITLLEVPPTSEAVILPEIVVA